MTPQLKTLIKKNNGFIKRQKDLTCHLIELNTGMFKLRFANLFVQNIKSTLLKYQIPLIICIAIKPFWQYIKSHIKDQAGISSLQIPDGVATTPLEKAEVSNSTIISVFTFHDSSPLPPANIKTSIFTRINITKHGFFSLLSQIDPYKASGPNNIPARVLKVLGIEFTTKITHLFKAVLAHQ